MGLNCHTLVLFEKLELPQNITDFVSRYVDLDTGKPCQPTSYRTCDVSIRVVLRKAYDIPFVPPLDVPRARGRLSTRSRNDTGRSSKRMRSAHLRGMVVLRRREVLPGGEACSSEACSGSVA